MFLNAFELILNKYSGNSTLTENIMDELRTNYNRRNRFYHTVEHLDVIYAELLNVKTEITNWDTIIFSLAWHDIIYNARKKNNEEKSAELAAARLLQLDAGNTMIAQCRDQILATKNHSISADADTNYFTDADLSILGAEPVQYQLYTKAIRKEYRIYPDLSTGPKKSVGTFSRDGSYF